MYIFIETEEWIRRWEILISDIILYNIIMSNKTLGNYDIRITSVRIRNALPDYEKLQYFFYLYILLVDT